MRKKGEKGRIAKEKGGGGVIIFSLSVLKSKKEGKKKREGSAGKLGKGKARASCPPVVMLVGGARKGEREKGCEKEKGKGEKKEVPGLPYFCAAYSALVRGAKRKREGGVQMGGKEKGGKREELQPSCRAHFLFQGKGGKEKKQKKHPLTHSISPLTKRKGGEKKKKKKREGKSIHKEENSEGKGKKEERGTYVAELVIPPSTARPFRGMKRGKRKKEEERREGSGKKREREKTTFKHCYTTSCGDFYRAPKGRKERKASDGSASRGGRKKTRKKGMFGVKSLGEKEANCFTLNSSLLR